MVRTGICGIDDMTNTAIDDTSGDREIEHSVMSYLGGNPHAADTLDGITRWWLPKQRYVTASARIEAVLQRLVCEGQLQLRYLPSGAAMYSAADLPRARQHPI
jgi:hypothetical protein